MLLESTEALKFPSMSLYVCKPPKKKKMYANLFTKPFYQSLQYIINRSGFFLWIWGFSICNDAILDFWPSTIITEKQKRVTVSKKVWHTLVNFRKFALHFTDGSHFIYLTIKATILQLFSCMNQLPFQSNLKVNKHWILLDFINLKNTRKTIKANNHRNVQECCWATLWMEELVWWTFFICLEFSFIMPIEWRERNQYTLEDVDAFIAQLKLSFLRTFFERSCVLGHSEIHFIVESIDSLSFWLQLSNILSLLVYFVYIPMCIYFVSIKNFRYLSKNIYSYVHMVIPFLQ